MYSANLIGKQMDTEFGLYLPEYSIPAPEVQTNYKEIPFRDGAIDKTSPDGVVHYKDREWDLTFKKTGATVSASDLAALAMSVMNAIHGKAGEIIFDDDPNYKWVGRVFVTSVDCENNGLLIVNIHMITHPYKYSLADIVVVDEIQTTSDEYEGSIVSLIGGIGKSITELLVSFSPTQDLHGYDHPWPAGGGKNIADVRTDNSSNSQRISITGTPGNLTFTSTGSYGRAGYTVPVVTGQTYTISFKASKTVSSGAKSMLYVNDTAGNWNYSYGAVLISRTVSSEQEYTKTITATSDTLFLGFYLSAADSYPDTVIVKDLQVELGSSKTSYSPYSNICPISGRTGLNVYRTGKNLLHLVESEMVSTGWNRRFPISLKAGTYILSCQNQFGVPGTLGASVTLTDENDQNIIVALTSGYSFGVTTFVGISTTLTEAQASAVKWIRFAARASGCTFDNISGGNIQLELGSTATTYEPYNGNTYSLDWTTEAGTVYGGTDEVVGGVLTDEWAEIPSYNGETITEPWLSSMDEYAPGATPTTGAQVVYELATPLTYQLTPQEIAALVGTNNVWSTGDSVSVTLSTMDKVTLVNHGKPMNPKINVVSEGSVSLLFEIDGTQYTAALSAGEYTLPDLVLFDGSTDVYEAGEGTITYTYPEVSL